MMESFRARLIKYATENRHRKVWKKRLYALLYSASFRKIVGIK